jgi:hypothetical protein
MFIPLKMVLIHTHINSMVAMECHGSPRRPHIEALVTVCRPTGAASAAALGITTVARGEACPGKHGFSRERTGGCCEISLKPHFIDDGYPVVN